MARSWRIGNAKVRPEQRQVLVDGAPVPIGSRAFDLLTALIERRDRVVGKGELLEVVWPGLPVHRHGRAGGGGPGGRS